MEDERDQVVSPPRFLMFLMCYTLDIRKELGIKKGIKKCFLFVFFLFPLGNGPKVVQAL